LQRSAEKVESIVTLFLLFGKDQHQMLKSTNLKMTVSECAAAMVRQWAAIPKSERLADLNETNQETSGAPVASPK
jgi:hypothetical protein